MVGLVVRDGDFVQSLQRGLAVIRAFDGESPALSLSEVARATGLARAAARRFLLTLVGLGYVRFDGRLFRLTPRVLELGRPYLAGLTLREVASPHLADLVGAVRESATVAVLDGTEIVYVAHVPAKRIMSISVSVGDRDPAFATSLGRVLLAAESESWLEGYLAGVRLTAITARTIVEPERLVSTFIWTDADGNATRPETVLTVTLTEHGAKTMLKLHQAVFESVTARDSHRGGWTDSMERLTSFLAAAA